MQTSQKIFTRDFVLAFLAQLALTAVMQLLIPTLPIYLDKLGSTEIEIGTLVGIFGLASVVSRPLAGRALLHIREKAHMIGGGILNVLSCLAYLVIPPFWPLLFVRMAHGASFAFFHTASTTHAVSISPQKYRTRVLGYFSLTMNIAAAVAPPIGIILVNRFGFDELFLVCSAIACSVVIITGMLRGSDGELRESPAADEGFLLSAKAVPPSVVGFFGLFAWSSLTTFFPLYAMSHGMRNPGLFFSVMATTLFLGRLFGGKILDIRNKERIIFPCILTSTVAMLLLVFSTTVPMFYVVAAIWGAGHALLLPALLGYALELSGSSTGPVVATFFAISDAGIFLGPLIMGVVLHYTSYSTTFLCLSLTGVISFVYFLLFTKAKRTVSA